MKTKMHNSHVQQYNSMFNTIDKKVIIIGKYNEKGQIQSFVETNIYGLYSSIITSTDHH